MMTATHVWHKILRGSLCQHRSVCISVSWSMNQLHIIFYPIPACFLPWQQYLTKCWDIRGMKSVSSHETMTYFANDIFHSLIICEITNITAHKYIGWHGQKVAALTLFLTRKGESVKISKQEVKKSKEEVKVGEYWQRIHPPPVAILSCPFGICFKYNFVFWLLWSKYITYMLILLWRLYIQLKIISKRIM